MTTELPTTPASIETPLKQPLSAPETIDVTEDDKLRFFKAFISDQPFTDSISLFDGKVVVEFKVQTREEIDDILRQTFLDDKEGITGRKTYDYRLACYRMVVSIHSVTGFEWTGNKVTKKTHTDENSTYVAARYDLIKNWNISKVGSILESFQRFEKKVFALEKAVNNQVFWRASK